MDVAALQARFHSFVNGLGQKFEPHVRQHLAKIYLVLACTTACTAVGAMSHMSGVLDFGIIAALGSLILVFGLHFYRDNGKNYYIRLGMLLAFGFCSGQTLGPLLQYIVSVNPAIIITALVGTLVTFLSLSMAALLAERGKYLYLGGLLVSVINTMTILSLFNMFFQSYFVQLIQLYVGMFVMAAFVVFDTQSIIEKCRTGNQDVIQHALDLFFDALSMFRRVLVILIQKEERKCEERRKQR